VAKWMPGKQEDLGSNPRTVNKIKENKEQWQTCDIYVIRVPKKRICCWKCFEIVQQETCLVLWKAKI
jgi:hypothetical protein